MSPPGSANPAAQPQPQPHQPQQGRGQKAKPTFADVMQNVTGSDASADAEHRTFIEWILRLTEDDPELSITRMDVKPGCRLGENFSSVVTRETVVGTRGGGAEYRCSVFVKRLPRQVDENIMLCSVMGFRKEAEAYRRVVPALRRIAMRAGLRVPVPKCFHASFHEHADLLVLQDMAPLGYRMGDSRVGLDLEHAKAVMTTLARFHALSLGLRRTNPKAFRRLRHRATELVYLRDADATAGRSQRFALRLAEGTLRAAGRRDLADQLAGRIPTAFQEMCDLVRAPSEGGSIEPVIAHGDCWINNLLFRYDDEGRVGDVCLLDLAGWRCSSPLTDVVHFMYTSLSNDLRTRHQDALLQHYQRAVSDTLERLVAVSSGRPTTLYEEARGRLGRLSLDDAPQVEVVRSEAPSLDALRAEARRCAVYGLWHSLWVLPGFYMDEKTVAVVDTPDPYTDEVLSSLVEIISPDYRQRVAQIVQGHVGAAPTTVT